MENKSGIDCVFLVPSNSKKSYQKLSETYSAIEPPTWALLLAQSLRSINYSVKIIDSAAENLNEKERQSLNRKSQEYLQLHVLGSPQLQVLVKLFQLLLQEKLKSL